jgi:hypothetical protein
MSFVGMVSQAYQKKLLPRGKCGVSLTQVLMHRQQLIFGFRHFRMRGNNKLPQP